MAGPSNKDRQTVLVLGQNNCQVLSLVRSLGGAGYRVVVGRGRVSGVAERSRFTDEVWPHPAISAGDSQFSDALNRFVDDRDNVGFIYPSADEEIAFLARNASALPAGVTMVMPNPATVMTCLDKVAATALAVKLGIPVASYRVVANAAELIKATDEIGLPCIVRPTVPLRRLYGRKAVICPSEIYVRSLFASWPEGHESLIVQAYVAGFRTNIGFAARDGKILSAYQYDSLRTTRPDGTGANCHAITVPLQPDLLDYTEQLATQLRYTGVGLGQFMIAPKDSSISFLELNPRLGGSNGLGIDIGLDFPLLGLELAAGRSTGEPGPEDDYAIGRRISSIHADLSAMRAAYRRHEIDRRSAFRWLGTAVTTFVRANVDTTWSWRDPLPGLHGFLLPLGPRRAGSR